MRLDRRASRDSGFGERRTDGGGFFPGLFTGPGCVKIAVGAVDAVLGSVVRNTCDPAYAAAAGPERGGEWEGSNHNVAPTWALGPSSEAFLN